MGNHPKPFFRICDFQTPKSFSHVSPYPHSSPIHPAKKQPTHPHQIGFWKTGGTAVQISHLGVSQGPKGLVVPMAAWLMMRWYDTGLIRNPNNAWKIRELRIKITTVYICILWIPPKWVIQWLHFGEWYEMYCLRDLFCFDMFVVSKPLSPQVGLNSKTPNWLKWFQCDLRDALGLENFWWTIEQSYGKMKGLHLGQKLWVLAFIILTWLLEDLTNKYTCLTSNIIYQRSKDPNI